MFGYWLPVFGKVLKFQYSSRVEYWDENCYSSITLPNTVGNWESTELFNKMFLSSTTKLDLGLTVVETRTKPYNICILVVIFQTSQYILDLAFSNFKSNYSTKWSSHNLFLTYNINYLQKVITGGLVRVAKFQPKVGQIVQYGTKLEIFQIRFQCFLARQAKM